MYLLILPSSCLADVPPYITLQLPSRHTFLYYPPVAYPTYLLILPSSCLANILSYITLQLPSCSVQRKTDSNNHMTRFATSTLDWLTWQVLLQALWAGWHMLRQRGACGCAEQQNTTVGRREEFLSITLSTIQGTALCCLSTEDKLN